MFGTLRPGCGLALVIARQQPLACNVFMKVALNNFLSIDCPRRVAPWVPAKLPPASFRVGLPPPTAAEPCGSSGHCCCSPRADGRRPARQPTSAAWCSPPLAPSPLKTFPLEAAHCPLRRACKPWPGSAPASAGFGVWRATPVAATVPATAARPAC